MQSPTTMTRRLTMVGIPNVMKHKNAQTNSFSVTSRLVTRDQSQGQWFLRSDLARPFRVQGISFLSLSCLWGWGVLEGPSVSISYSLPSLLQGPQFLLSPIAPLQSVASYSIFPLVTSLHFWKIILNCCILKPVCRNVLWTVAKTLNHILE